MNEFGLFAKECRGSVERYVRFKISNKSDADDVLQEIWLAGFLQFEKLKNKNSFKAWMIGIARNKVNDYFRNRRDFLNIDELSEKELVQSRYGLVEYSPVEETLEILSPKDREILTLFFFENMPQKEISKALKIPVGTVKSRLNTAKNNFKKYYPYSAKGENFMFKLPEKMPEYNIIPKVEKPLTSSGRNLWAGF